jgi:hypothetical protein
VRALTPLRSKIRRRIDVVAHDSGRLVAFSVFDAALCFRSISHNPHADEHDPSACGGQLLIVGPYTMRFIIISVLILSVAMTAENTDAIGNVGVVMKVNTGDKDRDDTLNKQLHFCIIDNGDSDFVYIGTQYGMWSSGDFDISHKGVVIKTIKIDHLIYNGMIVRVGDIVKEQPMGNWDLYVTRVTGTFK